MNIKKNILCATLALMALGMVATASAAPKERGLLADGELFTSERVTKGVKVIYDGKLQPEQWVWHNEKGYPQGMMVATFLYTGNLPQTPGKGPVVNGVPKPAQMVEAAKVRNAVASNRNSLILYVTTGPSAAQTDVAISKVEMYGRLLNVVVAARDAEPNKPLTMNLTYPETQYKIPLSKLPAYGNIRVRFVDMQGHALHNFDVLLGR